MTEERFKVIFDGCGIQDHMSEKDLRLFIADKMSRKCVRMEKGHWIDQPYRLAELSDFQIYRMTPVRLMVETKLIIM